MTNAPRPILIRLLLGLVVAVFLALPGLADTVLAKYLPTVQAADLVAGADAFGPIRSDLAVAPVLKGGQQIGWGIPANRSIRWSRSIWRARSVG